MRILVVNDDGIQAQGLRELARKLRQAGHSVVVVAPSSERSAFSHAITTGADGLCYERQDFDEIEAYSISGTPADCVKFGCLHLNLAPEIVLAGVNHGHNIGSEVMCSGTVAAASEGSYLGIRAMAISCYSAEPSLLTACAQFVVAHFSVLASFSLPPFTILNINYPSIITDGFVFTSMGVQLFDDAYVEEEQKFYLRGDRIGYPQNPDDCDVNWIVKNFITVTPLKADRTDGDVLCRLPKGVQK